MTSITRQQIEHCFQQATQAGRFSQGYCVDRILELLNAALGLEGQGEVDFGTAEEVIAGLDRINEHNAKLAGAGSEVLETPEEEVLQRQNRVRRQINAEGGIVERRAAPPAKGTQRE